MTNRQNSTEGEGQNTKVQNSLCKPQHWERKCKDLDTANQWMACELVEITKSSSSLLTDDMVRGYLPLEIRAT